MQKEVKHRAFLYLGLAALLTMLIAASLGRAQFKPGLPMPVTDGQSFAVAMAELPEIKLQLNTFFFVLFSFVLIDLIFVTFYRLMRGTSWRRLALDFFLYTLVSVVAFGALALLIAAFPKSTGVSELPTQLPAKVVAPLGPMPPTLLWLVGLALVVGVVLLGGGFVLARRSSGSLQKVSLLEAEAQKARQALLAGQDIKDVILQCYQQMCLALQQEKGVERLVFMTTGDFERLLLAKGYPYDPVHRLTGLFEAVRYGHWQFGRSEEQTALTCLEAIIHYEGRLGKTK